MIKLPPSNSVSLSCVEMREDFPFQLPAPVLPTMPTLWPPTIIHWLSGSLLCFFQPVVKPWSKSKSKSLSQQAPKLNKSPPKKEKEGFGPWADKLKKKVLNHPSVLEGEEPSTIGCQWGVPSSSTLKPSTLARELMRVVQVRE